MAIKDTIKKPFTRDRDTNVFVGLDLPIRRGDGRDGYFASTTTTIEAVKNNIRNLLLTEAGERIMQPDFGLSLKNVLFEQVDDSLVMAIQDEIVNKVNFWLPFVIIKDIIIREMDTDGIGYDKNTISIKVIFSIKQDPTTLNSIQVSLTSIGGETSTISGDGY